MKRSIIILIMFCVCCPLLAEEQLVFANTYNIVSDVMDEKREFHVHLPPSYKSNKKAKFPVVYLLDGDVHRLKAVSGMLEGLSTETLERQVVEAIVT